ncbi:ferritin-like domain-containing protein [Massilia aquatica]|uniref:Iminophenyl-pyruvate dimer synthase domain-containing protein n=1 Tax=Massilia aquatica TaxID=2609000 RepID=A0ABX0M373_9BURK|nr:ferritin-like protein [Massilia aquatica]NHZ41630.1 hypothetical protein [Massilia aquatica]
MILIQNSLLAGLDGPAPALADVHTALQNALELEHATIPPYLYALYSLDASRNTQIAAILKSVVTEEMLHMTLVANVLNALGGTPRVDRPDFVPHYPGPLPGGVDSQLTVNLAPFSMTQLDAFLSIEEPEHPLHFRRGPSDALEEQVTIGQFYRKIREALALLPPGSFVQPARNQVGPGLMREVVVVDDLASAQRALDTIIEQGEGSLLSPDEGAGDGYAHYYRFMQIKKGRMLVRSGTTYAYAGAAISFDEGGVYRLPVNPTAALYQKTANGNQLFAFDNFNYTYTSLLNALQAVFNGRDNSDEFNVAIGLMMSLKLQAQVMAAGVAYGNIPTGPSFQYQPSNPALDQSHRSR